MSFEIRILSFGTKRDFYTPEIERYVKMTAPFCPLHVETLKSSLSTQESVRDILDKEEKQLRAKIPAGAYVVVLAEEGRLMEGSAPFSRWLQKRRELSVPLVLILGNAYGISAALKKDADELISLSPLTMPYSICLLVITEQIYRANTILSGHPYHK